MWLGRTWLNGVAVCCASLAAQVAAGPVALESTGTSFRAMVTLANQTGSYTIPSDLPQPIEASLSVLLQTGPDGTPTGLVIENAHAAWPASLNIGVPVSPFGSVQVQLTQPFILVSTGAAGIAIGQDGGLNSVVAGATIGSGLAYFTFGTQCGQLAAWGTPCEFNGAVGAGPVAGTISGTVLRDELQPSWRIQLQVMASSPIWPDNPAAGSLALVATFRGSIDDQIPTCPLDWNGNAQVDVGDVFVFLTAWFAGTPSAAGFGGTTGVAAIFAYLSAWFAHGVGPC
ncbi:MAG: hypothetical protein KF699_11400 [Phycisphaeraceae bacterium]|nr:hypothetical protein [Phycisphaeraceae bacterium]